jgi:selenocysteine lyase/cysteine desulfurase
MTGIRELTVAAAQALWRPETTYLNTASYGLPPDPAFEELQSVLDEWRGGRKSWETWMPSLDRARVAFAELVNVRLDDVVVGASVSSLFGPLAASLPAGTRVLAPEGEFTSVLFPFMVQQGIEVSLVPLDRLADAVDGSTDVIAFSLVQSANGAVAAVDDLLAAARAHDALTVVDATQAAGWLPFDASRFDAVACHAYKWLMSPRGTAFMALNPELGERIVPSGAGWFSAEDVYGTYYDAPLRLAANARRFDTSPAWFSWVGTAPVLELINRIGVEAIHEHDVALANRFRAGLGLPAGESAIVSCDVPGAEAAFERAGILAAVRAGGLRASFHVYNTDADVDAALSALA